MKIPHKKTRDEKTSILLKQNMTVIQGNIRKLLLEKRMTQTELGYLIDKEKDFMSYLLSNRYSNTTVETMTMIANALGVTINQLTK